MNSDEQKPDFSNTAYLLPPINREGKRIGFVVLVFVLAFLAGIFFLSRVAFYICLLPLLFLVYGAFLFFRDPERYPPNVRNVLLSPADGRVCLIENVPYPEELKPDDCSLEEWNKEKHWRVSVFMSVFNVHVNRCPLGGTFLKKAYVKGKFFNASLDKASKDNERCAYLVESDGGVRYAVVQIAGLVARRIVPFVSDGDKRKTAERFGLIRFGSRLDVYLPTGVMPNVRVGQIMVSGETILGFIEDEKV